MGGAMLQPASHRIRRLPDIVAHAMRPLPLPPLQFALSRLLAGILERHPDLVGRLSGLERRRIAVDPDDLPFVIILEPHDGTISLRVVRSIEAKHVHGRIRGAFLVLMGLVDGTYDGDALFFSRDLAIEGDIEAILALRNAVDDASIDILCEVATTCGSYGFPLERIMRSVANVLRKVVAHGQVPNRGSIQ
jgi:predicted lipid carrier protein YhbT